MPQPLTTSMLSGLGLRSMSNLESHPPIATVLCLDPGQTITYYFISRSHLVPRMVKTVFRSLLAVTCCLEAKITWLTKLRSRYTFQLVPIKPACTYASVHINACKPLQGGPRQRPVLCESTSLTPRPVNPTLYL